MQHAGLTQCILCVTGKPEGWHRISLLRTVVCRSRVFSRPDGCCDRKRLLGAGVFSRKSIKLLIILKQACSACRLQMTIYALHWLLMNESCTDNIRRIIKQIGRLISVLMRISRNYIAFWTCSATMNCLQYCTVLLTCDLCFIVVFMKWLWVVSRFFASNAFFVRDVFGWPIERYSDV